MLKNTFSDVMNEYHTYQISISFLQLKCYDKAIAGKLLYWRWWWIS